MEGQPIALIVLDGKMTESVGVATETEESAAIVALEVVPLVAIHVVAVVTQMSMTTEYLKN